MATTKKTEGGKTAPKTAAKAGTKSGAKTAVKKTTAKKAVEAVEAPRAKSLSPARAKAKAAHEAPEKVRGRKERRGMVVSDAMDKTIVVRIDARRKHQLYGKVVRRSTKLHVHDEQNTAGKGDVVRVVETRPLSATKRWRLLEILEKAK